MINLSGLKRNIIHRLFCLCLAVRLPISPLVVWSGIRELNPFRLFERLLVSQWPNSAMEIFDKTIFILFQFLKCFWAEVFSNTQFFWRYITYNSLCFNSGSVMTHEFKCSHIDLNSVNWHPGQDSNLHYCSSMNRGWLEVSCLIHSATGALNLLNEQNIICSVY